MKFSALLKFFLLANVITTNFVALKPATANTFDEKEMDQSQVIAIVAPYRHGYNLVVIEQIEGKNQCWKEFGNSPVLVDLLLMNFDFTDHCRRATDTNGYSIRIAGQEYGTDYLLNIVEESGELHLIATSRNPQQSTLRIGRTHGQFNGGFPKIFLNPGWRFTKRSYQGQELSHFYFSSNSTRVANQTSTTRQINSPVMAESTYSYLNSYQNKVTLAKNTPILISILDTISIDIKDQETIPAAAILSEPLFDRYGRQLAPQGATVTITLKRSGKKTAKVYADSIMTGSTTISIKASSEEIASRKIKLEEDSHNIAENSLGGQSVGSLVGTALAPLTTQDQYSAIGGLFDVLIRLASGGKTIRLVELKAGHTLALKLEEDAIVNLPDVSGKAPLIYGGDESERSVQQRYF